MKRTLLFLLTTSLLPLTLQAQAPPPPLAPEKNANKLEEVKSSDPSLRDPSKLDHVQFSDANLFEIAEYLTEKAQDDPDIPDVNVSVSRELGQLTVPSLNLRNVSTDDVMAVIARLLDLELIPVADSEGKPLALIIKKQKIETSAAPGFSTGTSSGSEAAPAPVEAAGGGTSGDSPVALALPNVEVLHDSPAPTPATAPNKPVVKVFAIGAIIQGSGDSRDEREKSKYEKLDRLKMGLENICAQQKLEIQLSFHADMDIIVVRGSQPDALILIAETINAMKENALAAPDPVSDKAGRKP